VWKTFEKNKFETNIYDRTHGGNEKGANKSIAVDIATKATELQIEAEFIAKYFGDAKATKKEDKTTFIIAGNRNMMPAVKHVLKCKIRVELWGWKSGISQVYLDLAAINGLLLVHLLDSIFKDICFTAYRSTCKATESDAREHN
jgi:hypothetical protein